MLSESGEKTCNPRSTGRTLSWLHALFRWVGVDMSFKSFMGFDDFHVNNSVARKGKFQFLSKQKLVYTGNRYTECPSFDLETLINITADLIPVGRDNMAGGEDWRKSLTASERYDNIQKL
jgi:hypothetical protein